LAREFFISMTPLEFIKQQMENIRDQLVSLENMAGDPVADAASRRLKDEGKELGQQYRYIRDALKKMENEKGLAVDFVEELLNE